MNILQQKVGECKDILKTQYGKLLRISELCATVNAGSLTLSNNSSSINKEGNMCVGDRSGSPLVCDGVLTVVLVDRTKCAPGALYTFVNVAHSHALGWLSSHEPTGQFDHFVLLRDSSTTSTIVWPTANPFIANTTDPTGDSNTDEYEEEPYELQYVNVFMSSTERTVAFVLLLQFLTSVEYECSSLASHHRTRCRLRAIKWCSKRQSFGGVVLPRTSSP